MAAPTAGTLTAPASTPVVYAGRFAPGGGGTPATNNLVAITGDSLTEHAFGVAPIYWANGLLGAPLELIANTALAGQTVLGCYNQLANNYTDTYPGWVGLPRLGWGMCRIGTNAARYGTPVTGYTSTIDLLIDRMLDAADHVVLFPVPPAGGSSLPSQASAVASFNSYFQSKVAANPERLHWIDDCVNVRDGAGNVLPAFFDPDEVHQNGYGCYQMGVDGAAGLSALLASYGYTSPVSTNPADVFPAQPQWVPNHTNAGTSGTAVAPVTGTVPTGWTVTTNGAGLGAAVSIVAADVGDANATPWLRITPSAVQANSSLVITRAGSGRAFSTVDPVRFDQIMQIRLNAFDASKWARLRTWMQDGTSNKVTLESVLQMGGGPITKTVTLRQNYLRRYPAASGTPTLNTYLVGRTSFSGAMGSIDIRCHTIRG